MKKKILIALGVLIALAAAGMFALPLVRSNFASNNVETYQTQPAELGSLTAYVGATGAVRSEQSARLVWQTTGQIASVNVKKGQQVTADSVLAELGLTSISQNIINAQVELVNAQNALEDTLDNSEARINAQLALIQAQKDLDDAEKESESKLYQRASQSTIDIARANLIMANEEFDRAEEIYERNRNRGEDDPNYAAALSGFASAQQKQHQAQYNVNYVEGLPDPLDVEEVYIKLELAQVKLLAAREEWERIKDGPDPDDIAAAQARLDAAQATLDLTRLTAPFTGVITAVDSQTGDLVSAGTAAFQIDDLSHLLVDVEVSEVDINRVKTGQPVSLTFDAIPGQEYAGSVVDIASVGSTAAGAVNFTVTVEITNPDAEIRPGMTAAVNVSVSQIENALLVPSRAVRVVNNERVVYVLRDNLPLPVEISLGVSSNTMVQVLDGDLKPGDLIILNPPSNPLMMGPMGGGAGMGERRP